MATESLGHPAGLAIDFGMDHTVYWTDTKLNVIESMRPDGKGRRVVIRGDLKHPISLDVFESNVFWVTRDTGEVVRQDKFGRGVPVVLAKDLVNPSGIKGKSHVIILHISKSRRAAIIFFFCRFSSFFR